MQGTQHTATVKTKTGISPKLVLVQDQDKLRKLPLFPPKRTRLRMYLRECRAQESNLKLKMSQKAVKISFTTSLNRWTMTSRGVKRITRPLISMASTSHPYHSNRLGNQRSQVWSPSGGVRRIG